MIRHLVSSTSGAIFLEAPNVRIRDRLTMTDIPTDHTALIAMTADQIAIAEIGRLGIFTEVATIVGTVHTLHRNQSPGVLF